MGQHHSTSVHLGKHRCIECSPLRCGSRALRFGAYLLLLCPVDIMPVFKSTISRLNRPGVACCEGNHVQLPHNRMVAAVGSVTTGDGSP